MTCGRLEPQRPRIVVEGEVERPLTVELHELQSLADDETTVDLRCHKGWTRPDQRYRGLQLARLIRLADPRPTARYVTVASASYSVLLTREQVDDDRVLIATALKAKPLAAPRLVGPSQWDSFLSVKAVDRIELTAEPQKPTGPTIALTRIGR